MKMVLSGFGGQGMLLAGQLLAYAGMLEGLNVTWLPSYGPEMRGGSANCSVIISKEMVGSPTIPTPDVVVAMNQPSFDSFINKVKPGGLFIYNKTLVTTVTTRDDITMIALDATQIAADLDNLRVANMVSLGTLIKHTGIVKPESVLKALAIKFGEDKKHLLEINEKAIAKGAEVA
ncbi:MAG: 2-oxoacid:acceptor oxidoreductase family protein [Defluviitaleaceae bacterium]|nr:2-oxoacid:acceptor oxidoreductase family protein [Defluviitaleaceae bacterium]